MWSRWHRHPRCLTVVVQSPLHKIESPSHIFVQLFHNNSRKGQCTEVDKSTTKHRYILDRHRALERSHLLCYNFHTLLTHQRHLDQPPQYKTHHLGSSIEIPTNHKGYHCLCSPKSNGFLSFQCFQYIHLRRFHKMTQSMTRV